MESFPILIAEEARRWFALASFEVKGNWDDLMKKFCEQFFPLSKVQHIRKRVINFVQGEEEGIDQACDRFNGMIEQGLKLGFSVDVLLHTFYFSLTPECMQFVQMCAGGDLMEKTLMEAAQLLKKSARVRPCEEIGKNDIRQAPRKNLKCGCLLEFLEKRYRK